MRPERRRGVGRPFGQAEKVVCAAAEEGEDGVAAGHSVPELIIVRQLNMAIAGRII